jgi:hypothetical protein
VPDALTDAADTLVLELLLLTDSFSVVYALAVGRLEDSSEASDEAALESTLDNSEARELDTVESVAVAAILESSELKDDARLDNALDALAPMLVGTVSLALARLDASESTEDPADDTTLDASDTAEDTRLETSAELVLTIETPVPVYAVPVTVAETCSGLEDGMCGCDCD